MDLRNNIIIVNGINKTYQVEFIKLIDNKYSISFLNSPKIYSYNKERIIWLNKPIPIDITNLHIFIKGKKEPCIKSVNLFIGYGLKYYSISFQNNFIKQYPETDIEIRTSCLSDKSLDIFNYFKICSGINTLGINNEKDKANTKGILSSIYSHIDFIDDCTAAAKYLNPSKGIASYSTKTIIFPFGCNASQKRAVKIALSNQISVIQGPPGTGKTQTILNIIANLLIENKSVLVVSNNNSATENISDKLTANGLSFLVAPLGKKENKETFITNQPKLNPELALWKKSDSALMSISNIVNQNLLSIEELFYIQERLASAKQELAEVEIEKYHFEQEHLNCFEPKTFSFPSKKILKLLSKLKDYSINHNNDNVGFWKRIKTSIQKFDLELRLRFMVKIKSKLSALSIPSILTLLEFLYYTNKTSELKNEIINLEQNLAELDTTTLMESLTAKSMLILKAKLSQYFKRERAIIASINDLYHNGETILKDYPIVLSTTFSSKLCFDSDTLFDYVIMDEASQVAVETGLLALTCAKNAVIVGDTMQLPNVITDEDRLKLEAIKKMTNIPDSYDASKQNFLSSILSAIPNVSKTLLREHYRCHPDIINFCNQKFYGGDLLIMTKRNNEDKPLLAITTNEGHHSRGHYNQREIDIVKLELLPLLEDTSDIGIITPYNQQVDKFRCQLPDIEVATVHKYQGREKGTIIMSVTDDYITEFADNANLLNVAVSRAKDKFCLVVSGNPQKQKGNIHDLIKYIQYQNGTILKSKLHSIYDYLFTQISNQQRQIESISKYDSENLTFELIKKIAATVPQLSHIKALCHYPLRCLIMDTSELSEREIRYTLHPSTHIDFLIINRVSKEPLLAIETDGYN